MVGFTGQYLPAAKGAMRQTAALGFAWGKAQSSGSATLRAPSAEWSAGPCT
jgi:hypothetical protein